MLSSRFYCLIFLIIYFTYCQSTIRIGIIDDNENPKGFVNLNVPNLTFCNQKDLNLQLYWINTSNSFSNLLTKLEGEQNSTHIYITHTKHFYSKLIEDFSQIHHIPFINMKSYENKTTLCSLTTFVTCQSKFHELESFFFLL